MSKPVLIGASVVGAIVIIGGVALFMNKDSGSSTQGNATSTGKEQSQTAVDDPNGDYKLFSDPSITKKPEPGVKFGNGQVLSFEYDGSKTGNDPDATLSYQLYYISENSGVQPIGGGNLEGEGGKGTFKTAEGDKVFTSQAKGRSGFFELQGTYDTGLSETGTITGKNVKLGMYPIKFDISD